MSKAYRYSVIVPVYNAERTLHRCVDSLLAQHYPFAQIILINDGSKDSSGVICAEYASHEPNVVYISKPNGGVSSARNAGLDAAEGEYVTFVDSDDFVCENYFAKLDQILDIHPADYVVFSYRITDGAGEDECKHTLFHGATKESALPIICEFIYKKTLNQPWNKVYHRRIIEQYGVQFHRDLSIGEDRLFNIEYAVRCNSIYVSDEVLYVVSTENQSSLSRARRTDLDQQFQRLDKATSEVIERAELNDECRRQIEEALNFSQVRSVYSEGKRMHQAGVSMVERRRYIRSRCKELRPLCKKIPKSWFCRLLSIPVRFGIVSAIDFLAWRLSH